MKCSIVILVLLIFISCENEIKKQNPSEKVEKCPCDSIGRFGENGKIDIEYYFGKSLISVKGKKNDDTVSVTRRYTTDSIWHVQEYMLIANNGIVHPKFAIYCKVKDTSDYYKLIFVENENLKRNPDLTFLNNLGIKAILNSDTITSESLSILIPKEKFNGIIKLDKREKSLYKNRSEIFTTSIYLDSEKMVEYGDLLEQYNTIKRLCN